MFNQHFGNYLLERKILTPNELKQVLEEAKAVKVKLGILAIDSGLMNAAQVDRIHNLQASKDRMFGQLAVDEGYLSEDQLNKLLNKQKESNVLLGQVLIEKGFFNFKKYEEVLFQYRQDSNLTADEIQALKDNNVRKIVGIFLKTLSDVHSDILYEYLELFIRNIVRFIDDGIRVGKAEEIDSYTYDYLVTQGIVGKRNFFSGFSASEAVLSRFASIYAEEEVLSIDDLAKDALGEFLNCHNGLYLSNLSHKGIDLDLLPAEVKKDGNLKTIKKLYLIPCFMNFGKIDFLFAEESPDLA